MTTYRYSGTWKTTGFIKGNTKWHSGQIVIACDVSGFWRCSLGFSEKKPVSRDILLSGKKGHKIKNVHTKNRLQINLEDGTTIHVGDLHKDQLSEVGTLLMEIQNGKLPDRGFGRKLTPPKASVPCGHQSLVPSQTSPVFKVLSASPRHITGSVTHSTPMMKDSHSERHENLFALSDTEVEDFKENKFDRTPSSQRKTGKRFLEISQEKSRDTLAHLSTSGFYGNKTGNMQGPVGIISGNKRRPGLMPQFPERKKLCISNSPSSGYTWQRKTVLTPSNDRQTSLHGFSNLGNTCYMNAILQSLFALETFTADLWTLSRRVKNLLPYDQMQGKLYNCLTRLLVMKWRPNVTTDQHRTCLASVKRAISATAKRFSGQNQHDAHEFLSQVVDQLKEEVIKISKDLHSPNKHAADNHQVAARDGVTDETTEESPGILNPTSQNFEFEVRHIIRCLNCRHEVTKEESFHDLSLDMPSQRDTFSTASLQDALDQFLRKELIDYTCAECQHKKAEVTHKFIKLPRILVLHLKRYCFNAVTSSHTKTGRPISIARYLTLERHCVEDTTPAYPAPEPCSPTEFRPKPANDTGAAKARESTPQHRGGFSFHRPFLSLPHTLELEEEGTQGRNDTGKKVTLDKEENPKDVTHMDEDDQMKCLMEMSEKEPEPAKSKTPDLSDFNPESLTEEQMLQMAVEQSMQDSHLNNGRHDNRTPWRNSHQDASSLGSDTHCDTKLETSNGVLTNTNSGCQYDSNRSVNHDDSDKKVTVCQQCGANCYFVSSIGKYLCDCVTNSSDHRKQKLNVGDTPRSVSRTPRKLDFVSMENYCEPCPGDTAASGPCPDVTDPCSGRLMDSDSRVSGRRCDVLGEADCQDADFNHLVEMADLDDDVCSLGTQPHHYTETDMAQWNEQHNSSVNNGPSLVLDLTGEEEDKENKTPPPRDISAASMKDEPDWLSKTKESEERDFLLAVENSLRDQELAEQEQLSAITQQSLRECEKKEDVTSDEEDMFIVEDPEDEEKREALLRNVETGELGYSYQLMSVVSHLGSSSSLGHYVSDVYDIKQQRWYSYNDSDVTRTSEDIVRKSRERCGYIFFYLSKEIEEDLRDWFAEKNRESNEGYLHTRPVSR